MALSNAVTWIKENIVSSIVVFIEVLIFMCSILAYVFSTVYLEKFYLYDSLFNEMKRDIYLFIAFGLSGILLAWLMIFGCILSLSFLMKNAVCLRIFFLVIAWLLVLHAGLTFLPTIEYGEKSERLYGDVMFDIDNAFSREYHIKPWEFDLNATLIEVEESSKKPGGTLPKLKLKVSKLFDFLHKELECCGNKGPNSFDKYDQLPKSCCSRLTVDGECQKKMAYKSDCKSAFIYSNWKYFKVLSQFFGIILFLGLLAAIAASIKVCSCQPDND